MTTLAANGVRSFGRTRRSTHPFRPSRSGIDLNAAIARLLLFALGLQLNFHFGATYGDVVLCVTFPLWIGAFRHFHGAAGYLGLGLVTAAWGVVLSEFSAGKHVIDAAAQRDLTMTMLGVVGSIAGVLWARTLMTNGQIGMCYGLGMLGGALLHPGLWGTNPWKYAFAIPISVLCLGGFICWRRKRAGLIPLMVLAALSLIYDSRAYSVTLALCALILIWKALPGAGSRRYAWLRTAGMIALLCLLIYQLATSLLVGGYLGKDVEARSIAQIQTSGSLILGGRPEIAATWALMNYHPSGFGSGAVPTPADIAAAKTGLQSINYNPDNGYVDKFMFGGHFELHSVAGDVWAYWGLIGLLLVAVSTFICIRTLAQCVTRRSGDALLIYACFWTLWNVLFSPLVVSVPILVLGISLSLRQKEV